MLVVAIEVVAPYAPLNFLAVLRKRCQNAAVVVADVEKREQSMVEAVEAAAEEVICLQQHRIVVVVMIMNSNENH